jgi:hypothetical protein
LTYNLYVSKHVGSVIEHFPGIHLAQNPLYDMAKALLLDPEFMKEGVQLSRLMVDRWSC